MTMAGSVEAKKKHKTASVFQQSVSPNAVIPDAPPTGPSTPLKSTITVGKKFKGKVVGDLNVTGIQTTGSGPGAARDLRMKLIAPNGRTTYLIGRSLGDVSIGPLVIDASGIGYRLAVSAETLKSVPARGKQASLHAHLVARDDSLNLYGFSSEEERDLFLHLISVGSVGPKVAMVALSGGPVRELLRAIAAGDVKRFQAVPGIGKRTAERIIVELREKVAGEIEADAAIAGEEEEGDSHSLARDGLVNLGYSPAEAEELLDRIEEAEPEEMVAAALRRAGESRSKAA